MKSIHKLYLLLIPAFFCYGCDGAIESEYVEHVIVRGFIYPGEPIDSVVLHYSVPFGKSFVDSQFAVEGADVRVRVDGKEYPLLAGILKGRYYLPASELVIEGGKEYELVIKKDEHDIYARTRVPLPIKYNNLETSLPSDKVLPLDTNDASGFSYTITAGPVQPTILYMMQINALDTTVGKIFTDPQAGPPVDTSAYVRNSFIQTSPRIILYSRLFGWFGPNRMTILALDSNWVDYKRQVGYGENAFSPFQSSLNKVKGGIGIWGSAAKDTVTVYVKFQPN